MHAGTKAIKLWRQVPGSTITAGRALERTDSPVTASQTMHMHLNKVAWWLDLQASQSLCHLSSTVPCDPSAAVPTAVAASVVHESSAALHSHSADTAERAEPPSGKQVSVGSSLPPDQLLSGTRQPESNGQPSKGSRQGSAGNSQPLFGTGRPQPEALEPLPVSTSWGSSASAAVLGSPAVPTTATLSPGPGLQISKADAIPDAEFAAAASIKALEKSRQHIKGVARLQVGACAEPRCAEHTVSSASAVLCLCFVALCCAVV